MFKVLIIISAAFFSIAAFSQEEKPLLIKGNELYKQRQYNAAAGEYKKATDINGKSAKAQYNYGVTLYRTKKLDEAEKAFGTASDNSLKPIEKSKYNYNKGVSLTRQKKLPESIDAYKQALRLNPTDQIARENLQKALNELKKQNQSQSKNNNKDKQDNKKEPEDEKNESKMNKKEVEDKLDMLRREEKRLQQSVNKKNNPGTNNPQDW